MDEYESIMRKLDTIEEREEFATAEILQRRGTHIGRLIGILYGAVAAMILMQIIM